jgi:small ligand-binding sensory domain FIST
MRTGAALAQRPDWREALTDLIGQIPFRSGEDEVHLALLFASSEYRDDFPDLVARAHQLTGARLLVGCSGQGVIGAAREVEGEPALALLAFSLPGAELTAVPLTQEDLESCRTPRDSGRSQGNSRGVRERLRRRIRKC